MWSRLGSRGLPIVLGFRVLRLASPTPGPRHAGLAWTTARLAAASGDTLSAEQALRNLQLSSAWRAALKADTVRLALAGRNGELALPLLKAFESQAIESGDLQQATAVLRQLVALNPQDVEAVSLLGACLTFEDPAAALAALRLPAARGDSLALDLTAALDDALPADRSASAAAPGPGCVRHRIG